MKCSLCGCDHKDVDRYEYNGLCPDCIDYVNRNSDAKILAKAKNIFLAIQEGFSLDEIKLLDKLDKIQSPLTKHFLTQEIKNNKSKPDNIIGDACYDSKSGEAKYWNGDEWVGFNTISVVRG